MAETLSESIGEVLLVFLPETDSGKITWLIIVCIFILIVNRAFKLEWIGKLMLHLWCRRVKCPLGWHTWESFGKRMIDFETMIDSGPIRCKYCRKQSHLRIELQ